MLLDDLLDDRQAEAGAADPRGHVRLGQPLAVFGQADAGVENVDDELAVVALQTNLDAVPGQTMLAAISPCFNGFNTVFYNIGESLGELAAIANHWELAFRRLERERDGGMRNLVQEQRLADDVVDILLAKHRLGHACEIREFVDHPPQIADLPDDRPGQSL